MKINIISPIIYIYNTFKEKKPILKNNKKDFLDGHIFQPYLLESWNAYAPKTATDIKCSDHKSCVFILGS